MQGEFVYYRLFDVGASGDLNEMRRTIDMPFLFPHGPRGRRLITLAVLVVLLFVGLVLIVFDR